MEEFSLLRESKEITLLHNSIKIQLSVRKRKQHKIKPSVRGLYENFVYVDMASLGFIGPPKIIGPLLIPKLQVPP